MQKASKRQSTGFTLLELMVVIGIVIVIVGIALPVLNNAKRASYKANCASNLRQIYASLSLYSADHTNTLPQAADTAGETWDQALLDGNYITSSGAFACPMDTLARTPAYQPLPKRSYSVSSYVFGCSNSSLLTSSSVPPSSLNGHLSRCTRPLTQVVMLFERPTLVMTVGKVGSIMNSGPAAQPLPTGPNPNMFHVTGSNWLFADGHVEYLDFTQLAPNSLTQTQSLFIQKYFFVQN